MKLLNKELVEVEEHSRCKCDCRKKESDCTKFQRYNRAQCMCICINIEDKNKCLAVSFHSVFFCLLASKIMLSNTIRIIFCLASFFRKVAKKFGMQTLARVDAVNQKNARPEHILMKIHAHVKRYVRLLFRYTLSDGICTSCSEQRITFGHSAAIKRTTYFTKKTHWVV